MGVLTHRLAVAQAPPVIEPAVREELAGEGRARVIVRLHIEGASRPLAPAEIAAVRDRVLAHLAGTAAAVTRQYATLPLLALEIDAAALGRLETLAAVVARVSLDGPVRTMGEREPRGESK